METIEMIMWLLSLFAAGVLACWLAYQSTIVQDIKKFLALDAERDFNKYKWKSWFQPLLFIWVELRALLNCPYCMSFWLGFLINFYMWKITLSFSILYALLALVMVEIYRKLTL